MTYVQSKSKQLTEAQSFVLVKNLLRTAMYTVSYIRGIFPQNCFADKKYQNICVKTLRPETPDCIRLLKWLENGVFDALAKKYLDEAIFMIQGVEDENYVECYKFKITYHENNGRRSESASTGVGFQFMHKLGKSKFRKIFDKEAIAGSVVSLLRRLIQLVQGLGNLPKKRKLTMHLLYRDEITPSFYEPTLFKSSGPDQMSSITDRLSEIRLGNVNTAFHQCEMQVESHEFGENENFP
eukprot:CAMPEP_0185281354 /NCGR_PEP_ID=MMETSP1359-20130426/66671_1 /TAXON_ID=552665 /ORGANISM="Bigelowiella longifila, Strain CCMP242" /LENGTH=238 /DNA_ID=CAMNT_0027876777 /DNA_START=96 /DNA_END=809 /DNA_ORIENTATION=-